MSRWVAVLAGGSGSRLWPLSRSDTPKQLLSLVGERSLIQDTVDRVGPLVPPEHVLIVTEASHAAKLREQLSEIPSENILVEPARRGTAAAVALASVTIAARDPEATMASLHADAAVLDGEAFRLALQAAYETAESDDWLVTLGIRPTSPHTGMGYIEVGEPVAEANGQTVHRAVRFVEKPDRATATRFVRDGYVWNPGIFVWQVRVILAEFARLLPDLAARLIGITESLGTANYESVLRAAYQLLPVLSIDHGVMEHAARLATIPCSFGWSDVGSWSELHEISPKDAQGNVVRGEHHGLDTTSTLVFAGNKPVFTIGVKDLVVVDLPDALLICHRDASEQVKTLVEELQRDERWTKLT